MEKKANKKKKKHKTHCVKSSSSSSFNVATLLYLSKNNSFYPKNIVGSPWGIRIIES